MMMLPLVLVLIGLIQYGQGDVFGVDCDGAVREWDFNQGKWGPTIRLDPNTEMISISRGPANTVYGVTKTLSVLKMNGRDLGQRSNPIPGSIGVSDVAYWPVGDTGTMTGIQDGKFVMNSELGDGSCSWAKLKTKLGNNLKSMTVVQDDENNNKLLAIDDNGNVKCMSSDSNDNIDIKPISVVDQRGKKLRLIGATRQSDGTVLGITDKKVLAVGTVLSEKKLGFTTPIPNSGCVTSVISLGGPVVKAP